MSDATPTPDIRVKTHAEIAELVPYLLGFEPQESLVVLVVQDNQLIVSARMDIAELSSGAAGQDVVSRLWSRYPRANAYLLAYTADEQTGWELLRRFDGYLPDTADRQTALIQGDSWRLPDGRRGKLNPSGQVAATATFHGLSRVEHRSDLEAVFAAAPLTARLLAQIEDALATMPQPGDINGLLALTGNLLRRNLPPRGAARQPDQTAPTPEVRVEDAIRLSLATRNPSARTLALLSITGSDATDHFQLWRGVVNKIPAFAAEVPYFLLGMAAWVRGDGASANMALDRSRTLVPKPDGSRGSCPADLLDDLITGVVPPSEWRQLRLTLRARSGQRVRDALVAGRAATNESEHRSTPGRTHLKGRTEPIRRRPPRPGLAL